MYIATMRTPYPNELYHYGIPKQRWGFRRFQNKDGTLTPAGKKRYRKLTRKMVKPNKRSGGLIKDIKEAFKVISDAKTTKMKDIPKGVINKGSSFMRSEQMRIHMQTHMNNTNMHMQTHMNNMNIHMNNMNSMNNMHIHQFHHM